MIFRKILTAWWHVTHTRLLACVQTRCCVGYDRHTNSVLSSILRTHSLDIHHGEGNEFYTPPWHNMLSVQSWETWPLLNECARAITKQWQSVVLIESRSRSFWLRAGYSLTRKDATLLILRSVVLRMCSIIVIICFNSTDRFLLTRSPIFIAIITGGRRRL